jgi:hypothetical protein
MEDTDQYGNRNAPPLEVPPEQKESISRLLDMGYEFSQWIRANFSQWVKTGTPQDQQTKTAVFIPSVFAISGVTGQQAPITQTFY